VAAAPRRLQAVVALSLFATAFIVLAISGYSDASASWDEPMHLSAGYVALEQGDFRVDPSHPPLLRMWAALPARALGPLRIDTGAIDRSTPATWLEAVYRFSHSVMYVENDADRILFPGRLMIVFLGALLGAMVYVWAREWLGALPAAAALVLFLLEPNLMANASVVTTDLGVTTFMFGAVYFLWRTCRRPGWANVAAVTLCCAAALVSKFSAVILGPIVLALLGIAVARRAVTARMAIAVAGVVALFSFASIWAIHGFRYLPSASPSWQFDFRAAGYPADGAAAAVAEWADRHRLLPNAYAQGFLYAQSSSGQLSAFFAGNYSANGWWYYLPVAMLIKTPITHLVLIALGLATCVWQRRQLGPLALAFVLLPAGVYLAVAMTSGISVGVRHALPVYPFLLLVAAAAVRALATLPRPRLVVSLVVLMATGVAELATAYPYTGTFFNQFVGGPERGFRYLVDSNLGWGRNLKRLKRWMDANQVQHVNLAYFGQADPSYYHISVTHLPGAPGFATAAVARPRLPGYVAISPTILQGPYSPPMWRRFYRGFADLEPVTVIGNTLRVYWVSEWPEAEAAGEEAFDVTVHRDLGEALTSLDWPEHALRHFRAYVQRRPDDARGLIGLGRSLVTLGQIAEAMTAFREAVAVQPLDGEARLTLARVLFATRNLPDAATHAVRALELLPNDPEAHFLVGRIQAVAGRFDQARASFERALALDPAHTRTRESLAQLDSGVDGRRSR
jgi:tetratricopeptide (TPR) repeat protein